MGYPLCGNLRMPFNVELSLPECLDMPMCKVKLSLGTGSSFCQMLLLIHLFIQIVARHKISSEMKA